MSGLGVVSLLLLSSCRGTVPEWGAKIYVGDSERAAIVREQEEEVIKCEDARMDTMRCVTGHDLRRLYEIMLKCERWPKGMQMMTLQQLMALEELTR